MSLTEGVFQAISLLEKFNPPPFAVDSKNKQLSKSNLYNHSIHRRFRLVAHSALLIISPAYFLRWIWLIFHWESFTSRNIEQLIVYSIIIFILLIYFPAFLLFRYKTVEIINTINEACHLKPKNNTRKEAINSSTLIGKRTIQQLFVFALVKAFILLLPFYFLTAIVLEYLPIQLIFGNHWIVTFCAGTWYLLCGIQGTFGVLYIFLLNTIFVEQMFTFTSEITCQTIAPKSKTQPNLGIIEGLRKFRTVQIIFQGFNSWICQFGTNLVFVGILLASSAAYMSLKMYSKFNPLSYMFGPSITVICIMTAIIFTYLYGLPYDHSRIFKRYWVSNASTKYGKKLIQSFKPFGLELGCYGLCHKELGMRVSEDIIHNTIDLLLLGDV